MDPDLLILALTHRSFAYEAGGLPTNERLEFLGDSVLGIVVTDKLYHGLTVPDFPPVYRNVRLKDLVDQLRAAAASDQSPLIRYAFEVFVTQ